MPSKVLADNILIWFIIIIFSDDSHEITSLILSEKK